PEFSLQLKGGIAQLEARLTCAYAGTQVDLASASEPLLPASDSTTRFLARDLGAERAAVMRLMRCGFHGPDGSGAYRLEGQERVLSFFAREFPKLQRDWKVTMEERLQQSTSRNIERIEPRFEITSSGVQWFDFSVAFESNGGERFSAADIQRLILSGQSHTRLNSGKIALLDTVALAEFQESLQDCAPQQEAGRYKINATQAGFLDATLQEHGWKTQAPQSWRQRVMPAGGQTQLK